MNNIRNKNGNNNNNNNNGDRGNNDGQMMAQILAVRQFEMLFCHCVEHHGPCLSQEHLIQ